MVVKGTEIIQQTKIEVDEYEALKGLAYHFGCGNPLFDDDRDKRWMPEYDDTTHDLLALRAEIDVSYHGSPQWEPIGSKITDSDILRAYVHLKALKQLLMEERETRAK